MIHFDIAVSIHYMFSYHTQAILRSFYFQLQLKVQTSSMFKGKKDNYPFSVSRPFLDTRIGETAFLLVSKCTSVIIKPGEKIFFSECKHKQHYL